MCESLQAEGPDPFLKWAGGKRWLTPVLAPLIVRILEGRYFEPFLGGGAVFFKVQPTRSILGDSNLDLMNAYHVVQNNPQDLIDRLLLLRISRKQFEEFRANTPAEPLDRAVRLLYLNRTAFNGLWRVNRRGMFNVPFGCKEGTKLCDPDLIRACSSSLQTADLRPTDFRATLRSACEGDVVYLDPPYTTAHDNNGLRLYNEHLFSWDDQIALALVATRLARRGIHVVITNAKHNALKDLYPRGQFVACTVRRSSRMAGDVRYRREATEAVIVSKSVAVTPDALAAQFTSQRMLAEPAMLR